MHGWITVRTTLAARRGAYATPYQGPVYVLDAMTNNPGAAGGVLTIRLEPVLLDGTTGIEGLGILISEAVRGEGGILRDRDGKRFMEHYSPTLLDLAPRDIVARSVLTEIRAGRGIRGDRKIDDYVHLDATHLGRETLAAKLPDITSFCKTYLGIDPAEAPIPVQPTAHYAMGGIPTDVDGRGPACSPSHRPPVHASCRYPDPVRISRCSHRDGGRGGSEGHPPRRRRGPRMGRRPAVDT